MQIRQVAWGLGFVLLAALMYAVTKPPQLRPTSMLNAVFDTRWMIAGARLLTVVAIAYLLISIAVRVEKRQWVRSAGPVSTDATPIQAIADSQEDLQLDLREAKRVIDDLTRRLDRSLVARQALLDRVRASVDQREPTSEQEPNPDEGAEGH